MRFEVKSAGEEMRRQSEIENRSGFCYFIIFIYLVS